MSTTATITSSSRCSMRIASSNAGGLAGAQPSTKSALGVRRAKAALSSGCKPHPATLQPESSAAALQAAERQPHCLEYTYFESRGEWRLLDLGGANLRDAQLPKTAPRSRPIGGETSRASSQILSSAGSTMRVVPLHFGDARRCSKGSVYPRANLRWSHNLHGTTPASVLIAS
jgi:hypothetical protein